MVGERDDSLQSISVRLDGNNYSYWSYVMRNFLKGKRMWGYVSGVLSKPCYVLLKKQFECTSRISIGCGKYKPLYSL